MALHFTINPMTGSGSNFQTRVEITPTGANTTHNDIQDNLRVNAGGSGHPLTLLHYGIPITRRTNGQGNIASGGGPAIYVVETHYDYYFEGIPDWITLSDDGGPIQLTNGNTGKILKEMAPNNHYYFNVAANPSSTTRTTGHDITNFRNYRRDGETIERNYHTTITITQDAGVPDAPVINVDTPVYVFDWDAYTSGTTLTANITSNVSWTATCSNNNFVIVGTATGTNNGSIVVRPAEDNVYTSKKTGTITITNGEVSATISLTQYTEPYEQLIGWTEVNPTGDTKYMTIKSDYNFWYMAGSNLGGTNGYSTEYITMYYEGTPVQPAPTSEAAAQPATDTGKTYDFVWLYNDAVPKNDQFRVQYRGVDGVVREMRRNFSRMHQDNIPQHEDYCIVSPSAMTIDWWITSATNFTCETYSGEWSYDVQGNVSDFNFEKIGSQLKVSPKTQNTTNSIRNLSFSFSAGTNSANTTATAQQLRKPRFSYQGQDYTIPSSGTSLPFSVVSDYRWWIIDGFPSDYVSYNPEVNDGNNPNSATTGTTFNAILPQNTTGEDIPRLGTTYFDMWYYDRSGALRTDEYNHRISGFKQLAGVDELHATQSRSFADISSGGTPYLSQYYLTIYATAPWGITSPEWVSFNPSTGAADETIIAYAIVQPNSGTSRSGQISVSAGTATPVLINISQQAAYVPPEVGYVDITPKSLSVSSAQSAGNQFEVSANTAWTITSPEWVIWSLSPSGNIPIGGGNGSKTIYAVVSENSGTTQRTGTAVFSSATNSVNVSITQAAGAEPEPPTPTGYLELDPAQISPASSSYQLYEVEAYNNTEHNYHIVYGADWVKFYDGPYPSTAEEVSVVEWGERINMWLEVQAGHHGTTTILFVNEDDPSDYVSFIVNQQ